MRGNRALAGALSAITAAVVGVILNLAIWFALHILFGEVRERSIGPLRLDIPILSTVDPAAVLLTLAALGAMFRFKVGPLPVLAACAGAGVVYRLALA